MLGCCGEHVVLALSCAWKLSGLAMDGTMYMLRGLFMAVRNEA
jgi:hypothetical protein